MGIGPEFIFDSLGLDNPLVGAIPVLMNKLGGLIVVHRMNLILCVLDIRTLNLKAFDKHFFLFSGKKCEPNNKFPGK